MATTEEAVRTFDLAVDTVRELNQALHSSDGARGRVVHEMKTVQISFGARRSRCIAIEQRIQQEVDILSRAWGVGKRDRGFTMLIR